MKTIMSQKIIVSIAAAMFILSMVACATTGDGKRTNMEKLLTAAGFKKAFAGTEPELAELKKLPQRKLFPHEEGGKLVYIYADAKDCKCALVGDEQAYKKYQKLTHAKEIADEDRREAVRNKQRQMDSDDASFGRSW